MDVLAFSGLKFFGVDGDGVTRYARFQDQMKKILYPAIALTNRMSYTRKFVLLWLLSLTAMAVVAYSLFVNINLVIRPSQRQLEGLALVKDVSRAVQLAQQHRGFSSALLGGNEPVRGVLAAKEKEVSGAFDVIEENLPHDLASSEDWRTIKTSWEHLRENGLNLAMGESFAAHTAMIRRMRLFHSTVADEYALSMDSEIGTFYLIDTIVNKLPDALEHFGQMRGYGTGILAKRQVTDSQEAKLIAIVAGLESAIDELGINLGKTGRHNPGIRQPILAISKEITGAVRRVINLVESDIITGSFTTSPDTFMGMTTAAIDKGYAGMHDMLVPTTEALIRARIARAKNMLYVNAGVVLLLSLAVVYFSVGIYYSIIGSIQSLACSARAFINGDLSRRIDLDTRDELSRVGDIFNEMAEGFSALLELHRQSEKALSDLSAHLQSVREEEKASLAREIHDDLSGTLAAIKIDIYCLASELSGNGNATKQLTERIESISRLLDNAVNVTRNIITNLRPTILDDLGLLAAIEWQATQFRKRTGTECRVNCVEDKGGLDKERSIALFRIFQEALTNVSRHSGASRVEVEFHHSDDEVALSVTDNGCGAGGQAVAANSYGMRGMIERAEQFGGKAEFCSPPGGGFSVAVTLPLQADNQKKEKT